MMPARLQAGPSSLPGRAAPSVSSRSHLTSRPQHSLPTVAHRLPSRPSAVSPAARPSQEASTPQAGELLESLPAPEVPPEARRTWRSAATALAQAWRLAHRVANVLCWTLTIRLRQREAALRQRFAEEQKKQLEALAHTEQAAKAQLVACSAGVLSWLRSLGNPELTLEQKIGVQLPTGELGSSMQKLYGLASESSGALQQTLASAGQQFTPEGQKAFFRSEHTARVIEQEAQLKQLVYAQVLYGTA